MLAEQMGRSVREVQAVVDSAEFAEWIAFRNVETRHARPNVSPAAQFEAARVWAARHNASLRKG